MAAQRIHILLIEDNPGDRRLIQETLGESPGPLCEITWADRIASALEKLNRGNIDVVLLDLNLPDSSGLETVERVRAHAPGVPIVVMTGRDDGELGIEALQRGAQDYQVKGRLDGDTLLRVIRYAIERKRMEREVESIKNYYQDFLENANDLIQSVNVDARFIYVNSRWCEVLGYSKEEAENMGFIDILRPDQVDHCLEIFWKMIMGEWTDSVETVFIVKDGREIFVEGNVKPNFRGGEFISTQGIFRDVTGRKRAEEEIRATNEKLEERMKELATLYRITAILNTRGIARHEMLQKVADLLPCGMHYPELSSARIEVGGVEFFSANYRDSEWKLTGEIRIQKEKKGIVEVCCLGPDPQGDEILFLEEERSLIDTIAGQIGERIELKRAEERLRESEERFRAIFDNATDGILLADVESHKFLTANSTICRMMGYSLEEIQEMSVPDIHPHDSLAYVIDQFEKQANGLIELATDIPVQKKDGGVFYADVNSTPIALGGKYFLLGIFRDITARKHAENELKIKDNAIASAVNAIIFSDHNFGVTYVNPAFLKIWGYQREDEILGKPIQSFLEIKEKILDIVDTSMDGAGWHGEVTAKKKNSSIFDAFISMSMVRNEKGEPLCMMISAIDITERKQAETEREQLIQDLQEAITRIKTLGGLLPICSACKKIRDDKGYWTQLEAYIHTHSEAEFTHSICPECEKKLYPDLDDGESDEEIANGRR